MATGRSATLYFNTEAWIADQTHILSFHLGAPVTSRHLSFTLNETGTAVQPELAEFAGDPSTDVTLLQAILNVLLRQGDGITSIEVLYGSLFVHHETSLSNDDVLTRLLGELRDAGYTPIRTAS